MRSLAACEVGFCLRNPPASLPAAFSMWHQFFLSSLNSIPAQPPLYLQSSLNRQILPPRLSPFKAVSNNAAPLPLPPPALPPVLPPRPSHSPPARHKRPIRQHLRANVRRLLRRRRGSSIPAKPAAATERGQRLELVSGELGERYFQPPLPLFSLSYCIGWPTILTWIAHCDKYLCPATLSCVDKPSHCPCAWPNQEDKIEMSESLALCASKGGWKEGEMARKVDLARKGLM